MGEWKLKLSTRTPSSISASIAAIASRTGTPSGVKGTRLISRVPLTPEGVPVRDAIAAIDALIEEGVRVLNFSFHSPTLEPGHTPYVRSEADRTAFYQWWDAVLAHLARRGVAPASLDQLLAAVPARAEACKAA